MKGIDQVMKAIRAELDSAHALVAQRAGQRVVLEQVVEERRKQDRQWGGVNHDDEHERTEWISFLKDHLDRAKKAVHKSGDLDEYRQQLIEVAALAVAAAEAHDRRLA